MLNCRQKRVFNWLKDTLDLPVFAESYKGAVNLLARKSPGHITFIAHFGRDFMNGLAPTVDDRQRPQVQYTQLVDTIKKSWKHQWGGGGFVPHGGSAAGKGHYIPNHTCEEIQTLINEHEDGRRRSKMTDTIFFNKFFDYDNDKNKVPANFLHEWQVTRKWFMKHTHLRRKKFSKSSSDEVQKHFKILDNFLYAAATSAQERLRNINEILAQTN